MGVVEKMALSFSSRLCSQVLTGAHAVMEMDAQHEGNMRLPFQREPAKGCPPRLSASGIPDPQVRKIIH